MCLIYFEFFIHVVDSFLANNVAFKIEWFIYSLDICKMMRTHGISQGLDEIEKEREKKKYIEDLQT